MRLTNDKFISLRANACVSPEREPGRKRSRFAFGPRPPCVQTLSINCETQELICWTRDSRSLWTAVKPMKITEPRCENGIEWSPDVTTLKPVRRPHICNLGD